jgi:hypothetical protein
VADVFLSFDRADSRAAFALSAVLDRSGFSSTTEMEIPAGAWRDHALEGALQQACCVLVLWSKRSRLNTRICNQAAFAEQCGRYLPVLLERCQPPLALLHVQAAELVDERAHAQGLARLMDRVGGMIGRSPARAPRDARSSRRFTSGAGKTLVAVLLAAAVIALSGVPRNLHRVPDAAATVWQLSSTDALCRSRVGEVASAPECPQVQQRVRDAKALFRHFLETALAIAVLETVLWLFVCSVEIVLLVLNKLARCIAWFARPRGAALYAVARSRHVG